MAARWSAARSSAALFGNGNLARCPCEDHRYAVQVYAQGLDGPIGQRYEWHNRDNDDYGYFIPEREFQRDGLRLPFVQHHDLPGRTPVHPLGLGLPPCATETGGFD